MVSLRGANGLTAILDSYFLELCLLYQFLKHCSIITVDKAVNFIVGVKIETFMPDPLNLVDTSNYTN